MPSKSQRRATLVALAVAALVAVLLPTGVPGAQAGPSTADVHIRDNETDTGVEPSTGDVIWKSPDIVVCPLNTACTTDVSITPGQAYDVYVTLRKNGTGTVTGQLRLYYTKPGGDATWEDDWQLFSVIPTDVTGSTKTVKATWTVPSQDVHYCLLARWVSDDDPMNLGEGTSTSDNTRYNNNIAWHNVNTSLGSVNVDLPIDFTFNNPFPVEVDAGLAVTPDGEPFVGPGSVVVDLGATLFERWRAGGGRAVGVRQVGTTRFQVVDPKLARFTGLRLRGGEKFPIRLTFRGTAEAGGKPVNVVQTDAAGRDRGGVQYRLTFR